MFQKVIVVILLSLLTHVSCWSQEKNEAPQNSFWKNVRFGGGMQLSIGSSYTTIGVSPSAIYEFSDKWATGVGVSYLYAKYKLQDIHYNVYGASTFVLYNPIREIQLSTEFETLNVHTNRSGAKNKYWTPALYLGVAYSMNRNVAIGIRYDVLYDSEKSIYDKAFTPFIRVYF